MASPSRRVLPSELREESALDAMRVLLRELSSKKADSMTIQINVLDELFHFISFDDWLEHAQLRFRNSGHTNSSAVCIDAVGMVCTRGKHFKTAKFPVRVYAVDDPPYEPSPAFREPPEAA